MSGEPSRLLLVLVGTDHHPFHRLVTWVDEWLELQQDPPQAMVQHGTSHAPRRADGVPLTGKAELERLMASADVVVTHGGPATITEVRRHGRLPLVVPRDPRLGEHVDEHQQLFARRMDASDFVRTCETREDLHGCLSAGFADPSTVTVDADADRSRLEASLSRFAQIVDALVADRGSARRRRGHLTGPLKVRSQRRPRAGRR